MARRGSRSLAATPGSRKMIWASRRAARMPLAEAFPSFITVERVSGILAVVLTELYMERSIFMKIFREQGPAKRIHHLPTRIDATAVSIDSVLRSESDRYLPPL